MHTSHSIDLHNCTVSEAMHRFVCFYNSCVHAGYRGRIEVIHGYGSSGTGGAIRNALRAYLKAHAAVFGDFLAGESLRNPGVTVLYAKETLAPSPASTGHVATSAALSAPHRRHRSRRL